MGSAARRARGLAEEIKTPGAKELGGTLSGIIGRQLEQQAPVFTPPSSTLGTAATGTLTRMLSQQQEFPGLPGTGLPGAGLPDFSFVTPREIPEQQLTLSATEQARRKRLAGDLSQRARDSLAARGLNRSAAGAEAEGRTLSRFYENLASQDFERERALTREAIAKEQLRLEADTRLFTQQMQAEAFKQGRQDELFSRQMAVIDRALAQAGVAFEQAQTEFTTNLAAAGMPIQQALEFMALAQRGDIAGAELILRGMGIDQQNRNALIGFAGNVFGGITRIGASL